MEIFVLLFLQVLTLEAVLAYTMMMLLWEEATFVSPRSLSDASTKTPMPELTHGAKTFCCLLELYVSLGQDLKFDVKIIGSQCYARLRDLGVAK